MRTGSGQRSRIVLVDGSVVHVNQQTTFKIVADRRLKLEQGEILVEAVTRKEPFVVETARREVAALGTTFAVQVAGQGTGVVVTRGRVKVSEAGGGEQTLTAGQQLTAAGRKPEQAPRASHLFDWARDLMISAESSLVPASSHSGGSLTVVDPQGQEAKLHLRKYHVDVHIEDGFARTTIDQTYFNHTPGRLEGMFHFPLPADASLSRLAMYVEGNRMEGGMVEREQGRNIYESIVTRQQDPALLEWVDGTTFRMRVFPLEPRQEKRIILSYTQRLSHYSGQETYRFPAGHSLDRVRDWSLNVRVKGGAQLEWNSLSHTLKNVSARGDLILSASEKSAKLDRDVVLVLGRQQAGEQTRLSMIEHEGGRYLMVRHRPELLSRGSAERRARDMVILFETSGDRNPLLARAQVEIVRGVLQNAEMGDRFRLLTAATRTRSPHQDWQELTPENVEKALRFLEDSHLIGALDLGKALTEATGLLKGARDPHLIHVGSGITAMGEQQQNVLAGRVPEGVKYVGVGVGRRWNRSLMKALAEKTGGLFTQINPDEPISWRTFELAGILNAPRLLNVSVSDSTGRNNYLTFSSLVNQGEEVCAVARLTGDELPRTVRIRGTCAGQVLEVEQGLQAGPMNREAGYLPRTWARLEIDRLLAEDAHKHRETIVRLSKAMYVMSPFTSLLVLENEAMYQQYKVDRGRKDHWALYDCPEKIEVVCEDEDGNRIDPKKLSRPTAKEVLKTIQTRRPASGLMVLEDKTFDGARSLEAIPAPVVASPEPLSISRAIPEGMTVRNRQETLYAPQQQQQQYLKDVPLRLSERFDEFDERTMTAPARVGQIFLVGAERTKQEVILRQVPILSKLPVPIYERGDRNISPERRPGSNIQASSPLEFDQILEPLPGRSNSSLSMTMPSSPLFQRPIYSGIDRLFFDLVSYAPGMNTSVADILGILESEAAPAPGSKPGRIDPAARKLLDAARGTGWRTLTLPAQGDEPTVTITFDERGRYVLERTLFPGIREKVVCDGQSLWHLYPDLNLGAKRTVTRFHRLAFARLVPWALPRAEDLARGADLVPEGERTVALVPHGADQKDADGKPLTHHRLHLVFARDGSLAEQQFVEMPSKKVLGRVVIRPSGEVRVLGEKDKEIATVAGTLEESRGASVVPDVKNLVVLPLPYRTREHVLQARKLKDQRYDAMPFDDALALLAADFAAGNNEELLKLFREGFHGRDQRQLGLYVLLAAAGQNLDGEHLDVLAEHRDDPLAQYLALHTSPVLRKHASQWALSSVHYGEGFLRHLAVTHAQLQRWSSERVLQGNAKQRQEAIRSAIDYLEKNRNTHLGFALLGLMADRAAEAEQNKRDAGEVRQALVRLWPEFEKSPGLENAARYESARALWKAGRKQEARKVFLSLYADARKNEGLLPIDEDFHRCLLGEGQEADEWNRLIRGTARELIEKKQRWGVLALAWQCWSLNDQSLAEDLLSLSLEGVTDRKERLSLTVAVVKFLKEHGKPIEAERFLQPILADQEWSRRPGAWRLAASLASDREQRAQELAHLERALDAEYRDRPEVMNLETIDREYRQLLEHYQNLAEAMVTLKVKPTEDFLAKVVRTADRWRSLSGSASPSCERAARILRQLGETELAWDYLTTPVGLYPGTAEPWLGLARNLRRQGELKRADEAFASAFAAEPTNAQILWDRIENLRQAGNLVESRRLLRQLADGDWQPRFRQLAAQARWQLEQR